MKRMGELEWKETNERQRNRYMYRQLKQWTFLARIFLGFSHTHSIINSHFLNRAIHLYNTHRVYINEESCTHIWLGWLLRIRWKKHERLSILRRPMSEKRLLISCGYLIWKPFNWLLLKSSHSLTNFQFIQNIIWNRLVSIIKILPKQI